MASPAVGAVALEVVVSWREDKTFVAELLLMESWENANLGNLDGLDEREASMMHVSWLASKRHHLKKAAEVCDDCDVVEHCAGYLCSVDDGARTLNAAAKEIRALLETE